MTVGGDERTEWDAARSDAEVGELVAGLTEEEKLGCLDGDAPFWAGIAYLGEGGYHKSPFRAARIDRIAFPGFRVSDGPRGVVVGQATCFPVSMARGATFDPDLEERIGEAIGRELRSIGADLFGGICVNVLRHPAWGRAQETYGEDPYLVGEMGAALCRGVQRHAMACVKHLACNSMENARFQVDVTVDEIPLHEVFLPHFRRVVDEGVAVVMSAYNSVNGSWCGENRELLTEVLRDEWGFEGFVISDWIFGIRDAARSLHGGLDVEMPYHMVRASHLRQALSDGSASWSDVDAAAARVVTTCQRFDPVLAGPAPGREVLACAEHRALARGRPPRGSLVLLRNEPVDGAPVLPLDLSPGARVAPVGGLATQVDLGDGGSSDVWAPSVVTPQEGLRERDAGGHTGGGRCRSEGGGDPRGGSGRGDRRGRLHPPRRRRVHRRGRDGDVRAAVSRGRRSRTRRAFHRRDLDRATARSSGPRRGPPGRAALRRRWRSPLLGSPLRGRGLDPLGRRGQPADSGPAGGRECRGDLGVGPGGPGDRPVVVLGDGRRARHRGRPVRAGRRVRAGCRSRSPSTRWTSRHSTPTRPHSATTGGTVTGTSPAARPLGLPLRLRAQLHDLPAASRRRGRRRRRDRSPGDAPQRRESAWFRRRPGLRESPRVGPPGSPLWLRARVEIDVGGSVEADVRVDKRWLAERDPERHAMVVRTGTYDLRVARHACDPGITLEVELRASPAE